MANLEWVFTSDWHLGKLKKLFPENHLKISMREIKKPLDYAVKNGIEIIIHGGDVFDFSTIDHKYSKALINLFLQYPMLQIYIILGNHDFEDIENHSLHLISLCSEFGILPNVHIIQEKREIELFGIPFNFMPYPNLEFSKKLIINIAHTEINGARRDNNLIIKRGLDLDNEGSLNFIGHIHRQQKVNKNTWFCGAPYQTTFGEQGSKGWYHIDTSLSKKFKNKVKFVKNVCGFELINLRIDIEDDFKLIEKDKTRLYKLHLSDGIVVPQKLTLKNPNIVNVVGFKGGEEYSLFSNELPEEMYTGTEILTDLVNDPIWGLLTYLKEEGLTKGQRRRAIQLVEDMLKNNTLE